MKPELLAPANLKTLHTAVQAGADAVYLAGNEFGARKFADNFDLLSMQQAVDYCHLRNVKVYLAANILIDDGEIKKFLSFIKDAYNLGIDAFILQDIGMARQIKQNIPDAKLHASTQLTVHNTDGAAFMKEIGFDRVVTARELSKNEIFDISSKGGIETEIFVHGALCMSYSGQCLMSSLIGGRSGNRGSCAQPCRLPYELYLNEKIKGKGYYLSPRDLSLSGNMTDVLNLSVSSLKIEGRMKGPEYVAAAVSVLRALIDENRNATEAETLMLENAFSRDGFTSGAFGGDFSKYINSVRGNDEIYKNRDMGLLKQLTPFTAENANLKKTPVSFAVYAVKGEKLKITASAMGFTVDAEGEIAQKAENKATDAATIEKQVAKTGDYPFYADKIIVETDGETFLPLSEINSVRRQVLERLQEKIVKSFKRESELPEYCKPTLQKSKNDIELAVMVSDEKQLKVSEESGITRIFAPCEIAGSDHIAVFPDVIHDGYLPKYIDILNKTESKTVYTANHAIIKQALTLGKKVIASPALNVFNGESINFWADFGISEIILSQELNIKQIAKLNKVLPTGAIVYGRAAMMKTVVCPVKAANKKCEKPNCKAYLKDRKNEKFPVACNGMTTFILNSKPIYMADKLNDLQNAGTKTVLLHFTVEEKEECRKIIEAFKKSAEPNMPFTRGHFYRGVV